MDDKPYWERRELVRELGPRLKLTRNRYGAYILRQEPAIFGLEARQVVMLDSEVRDLIRAFEEMQREARE